MPRPVSEYADDVTVYLVVNDFGHLGRAFVETDMQRAVDADDNLGEDTKRFIDRHMRPGEKRPPAPSVRRGRYRPGDMASQSRRVT